MRPRSYAFGVKWIALNDDPSNTKVREVYQTMSVHLLADLFGVTPLHVADDVVAIRMRSEFRCEHDVHGNDCYKCYPTEK